MLNVKRSIFIGVYIVLFVISAGFIFRTQGWPRIYLIPPNDPSLFFGSLINKPSRSILIYPESSTCAGNSIY
jgi:hypothetical protein